VILPFPDLISELRCIALDRPDSITYVIIDRYTAFIDEIPSIPEINDFNIELRIQQHVLRLDVAVGNSPTVDMSHRRDQLPQDKARRTLTELLGLVD
jgi:hypothetical protein